jgi:serine phosphatase RsbU (regulator of sigma subunit)
MGRMISATLSGLMADRGLSDVVRQALTSLIAEVEDLRTINRRQASRLRLIDDDLKEAAIVQRDLLPASIPYVHGLNIEALYRPAGPVSGDLYDVCRIDGSHIAFWVADATGHGVSAGLIAAFVKGALCRSMALSPLRPDAVLSGVNAELLTANFSECQFVTAVYGVYDERRKFMKIARAGAPGALFIRTPKPIEELTPLGPMLGVGVASQADFGVTEQALLPGQSLLIHTDGMESLTPLVDRWLAKESAFDARRFLRSLDAHRGAICDHAQADDVTVLALQAA